MKMKKLTLGDRAIIWAATFLEKPNLDCFGGYGFGAYRLGKVGFINEVGNESTKYAEVNAYDLEKLIRIYKKYGKMTEDNGDLKEEYHNDDEHEWWNEICEAIHASVIPWD